MYTWKYIKHIYMDTFACTQTCMCTHKHMQAHKRHTCNMHICADLHAISMNYWIISLLSISMIRFLKADIPG